MYGHPGPQQSQTNLRLRSPCGSRVCRGSPWAASARLRAPRGPRAQHFPMGRVSWKDAELASAPQPTEGLHGGGVIRLSRQPTYVPASFRGPFGTPLLPPSPFLQQQHGTFTDWGFCVDHPCKPRRAFQPWRSELVLGET